MRLALCFSVLVFSTACNKGRIPMEAELVEITPDELVVDVKSTPGVRVDFGLSVGAKEGVVVPADGKVRLKYPRKSWQGYDSADLELAAGKRSFGRESWGEMKLPTPARITSYLRIEKDEDSGLWFAPLRIGEKVGASGTIAFNLGEEKLAVRLDPKAKKFTVVAAAPIGAEVTIGGTKIESEKPGIAEGELPLRELAFVATVGETPTLEFPVVVTKDDDSAKYTIELTPFSSSDIAFVNERVLAEVDAIEDGKFFPSRPSIIQAVLVRTDIGTLKQLGKSGPVGDVRFVAIEKATRRDGASCMYNTFSKTIRYDDIDVKIVEARTGKQVGTKKFPAPYVSCPQYAMSDDYFVWQAPSEKIEEWISKTALGK